MAQDTLTMTVTKLTEKDVIELLQEKQGDLTNAAFAEVLGVDESYLSKIYNGRIPVGKKLVEGMARRYAELRPALGLFLLGDLRDCTGD